MKNNYELNSIFSPPVLNDLLNNGKSSKLDAVFYKYSQIKDANNQEKFQYLYQVLNRKYRNEYFYKNTLFNKQVLGIHSLNTTTAFTEFPISNSIADFLIINKKAHVIEIKTKLDNLERLNNQILDYYKAFDTVTILCDEKHLTQIEKLYGTTTVGISILTKRGTIKKIKQAMRNRDHLRRLTIYKTLRKPEREKLVKIFYKDIRDFSPVEEYEKRYELLSNINIDDLYTNYIKIIKKRNYSKKYIDSFEEIPYELKAATFFSKFNSKDYHKLIKILKEI